MSEARERLIEAAADGLCSLEMHIPQDVLIASAAKGNVPLPSDELAEAAVEHVLSRPDDLLAVLVETQGFDWVQDSVGSVS